MRRRIVMKRTPMFLGCVLGCCLFSMQAAPLDMPFDPGPVLAVAEAAASKDQWVLIGEDAKYGKYFAPSNVQIVSRVNGIPTRISAWIKTTYSPEGAQETVDNYEIQASIPNPAVLSYSLALVEVNPQLRTIEYAQENFYDAGGNVIWSKVYTERTVKEINSQSYDEDYYIALVDTVFHHGEKQRSVASDRWITLWKSTSPGGASSSALADTTTMRQRGDNVVYWEWMETKDKAGNVTEVKFMKKAMNVVQGTQRVIECKEWSPAKGWQDLKAELDGLYYPIAQNSAEANGLKRMRAFSKGYQYWLNRYRTDLPSAGRKDTTGSAAGTASNPAAHKVETSSVPGAAAVPRA